MKASIHSQRLKNTLSSRISSNHEDIKKLLIGSPLSGIGHADLGYRGRTKTAEVHQEDTKGIETGAERKETIDEEVMVWTGCRGW